MAVTRINNNQITDASAGNVYTGVNAASKIQNYTITSTKIANNLTYGSDLTVTGNLTVNGTTTTIDTVNTLIQDPLITLADGQTTGTPAVDIGTIGLRGSELSAVMVWKEDQKGFITALSNTTVSNTTVNINGYANLQTGNATVQGTTSLVGNLIGAVNASDTITGGNLATPGTASAGGNITGGNVLTGGLISATGTIDSATTITGGNLATGGTISGTGTITGGNLATGGTISGTGNITGGNISTGGIVSATGNVVGGNLNATTGVTAVTGYFTGNVDVLGNLNASIGVVYANSGIFYGNAVTGNNAAFAGVPGYTPLGSNVVMQFAGNVNSYSQLNFQNINSGNIASTDYIATADNGDDSNYYVDLGINSSTFDDPADYPGYGPNDSYVHNHGGNLILNPETAGKAINFMVGGTDTTDIVATMTATELSVDGTTSVTGTITGGNLATAGTASAGGNVTGANILTGGLVSATGTITSSANITGGNILTGGLISATGNVTGANVNTNSIVGTGVTITSTGELNLAPTGNITANSKNIISLADPVNDQDAATKAYVDSVAQGLDIKASVTLSSAAALPTYTYNNGTAGVGATLTATANGALSLDGQAVTANARVLIKNETAGNAPYNGIYVVTATGDGSNPYVLTRATDFDNGSPSGEIPGAFTFVEFGDTLADTGWVCTTNSPVTVGTTAITFAQFSGAGSYTAGDALSLTGTQFNVLTDGNANPTIDVNGSNQLVVPAGAEFITPNIGAATGTTLSTTGTVTSGNVATGGTISATGTITGGNVETAGTVSATATITGGNLETGGTISGTGNITGGNVLTAGLISSTGAITSDTTITGGNLATAGTVSATATITGGNIATGGTVSATGNITGGNILTGGLISVTGNVTAANFFGNIAGNIDASGSNTWVQFNDTGDILGASAGFTFDKTANLLTVDGNISGANVLTGGLISATATITGGNLATAGTASATGTITGGNLATGGTISGTGNVTGGNIDTVGTLIGGNIVISGDNITDTNGRVNFNTAGADVDFAVNGDTVANAFYVDAGTGTASFGSATQTTNAIVAFNATTSILMPTGITSERPGVGVTGMVRFNTTNNNLEVYDNSQWTAIGVPVFTVIDDEQFNGDGSTVAFTLASTQTTNSCIVSINGVVQIPTIAYSVSGTDPTCVLTFTEAPETGDIIDVRQITTTTTVTSIANSSGNAVVAVSPTADEVNLTGQIIPTGNGTQSLGSNTNRFSNIWLTGSTITLGNTVLKNTTGNSIGFFGPDGTTPATIDAASVDTTTIANGTSNVKIATANSNVSINVAGSGVVTFGTGGITNDLGNGVGNIGSASGYFNTVFAQATSAQYADLAEKYVADAEYAPGTVVVFGGTHEVTVNATDADRKVAGVVSTNPSYIMNGGLQADHVATVALTGRVPTMVVGTVRKGDLMVAAGLGRARSEADPKVGTVIGKALEDFDGAEGTIEVVVGRF